MQASWTERIPQPPLCPHRPGDDLRPRPRGSFAGELFEESQPLPTTGTQAPTLAFGAGRRDRHRALLLLDLYATALVIGRDRPVARPSCAISTSARRWQENRFCARRLPAAILAFVAALCFQAASRLWGRFNFESVLVWVEMMGNWQTSRIGTGNNFTKPRQHREQASCAPRR